MSEKVVVVAMTGASGSLYGVRLLQVLLEADVQVHLIISPSAVEVFRREIDREISLNSFELERLLGAAAPATGKLVYHHYRDFSAGPASGSFPTSGMVICPCSMGTLSAIASGLSTNLIQRAADVHLKERRKLIVVPRETPLGLIQLRNMTALTESGAVVLPAMPGFYQRPERIEDLIDFVVLRICDQLAIPVNISSRWGIES